MIKQMSDYKFQRIITKEDTPTIVKEVYVPDEVVKQIRADAIDDFRDSLIKIMQIREESHFYDISEHDYEWLRADIMNSAKRLKEQIEKEQDE